MLNKWMNNLEDKTVTYEVGKDNLDPYSESLSKLEKLYILDTYKKDDTNKNKGKIEVINIKDKKKYKKDELVYIGRGSIFGNIYSLRDYGRELCIERYEEYMEDRLQRDVVYFLEMIELVYRVYIRGEDIYLMCFCKPSSCHGDLIKDKLEEYISIIENKEESK